MNWDLLGTILFILFFVVGPLLQRGNRGQRRRPPTGGGTRPRGSDTGSPPLRPEVDQQGPLADRLEEARRRVLEAMGEEVPRAPKPPQPVPQAKQELNWQEVVKPVESYMGRRPQRSTLRSETGEVISAPPLRTERRRATQRTARLSVGQAFGTTRNAIVSGIIWHEILSEPVSRRGNRRVQSRLRSR